MELVVARQDLCRAVLEESIHKLLKQPQHVAVTAGNEALGEANMAAVGGDDKDDVALLLGIVDRNR